MAVLVDSANLGKSAEAYGLRADYRRLARYFRLNSRLARLAIYVGLFPSSSSERFARALASYGYSVVSKPIKVIVDRISGPQRKANFDVELTIDAVDWLPQYDTLVLFSGDSDFDALLRRVKRSGKRTIVCSLRNHVAKELIQTADYYLDVRKLGNDILSPRL